MKTVCDSCLTALDGLHTSKGATEMWNTIQAENWDAWSPDKIMVQLSKRFRQYMPKHECDITKADGDIVLSLKSFRFKNSFGQVIYNCECAGYQC